MLDKLYPLFLNSTGVSTDTRTVEDGNIWFALKGPNFDANKFADQAIEKGASVVVIDDPKYAKDDRYLVVEDGLEGLQSLANHHRKQFEIPVIAITGSNGKTTTKELVRDVLAQKFNVLATNGNLNNHIGVPLTLLRLSAEHELAIIEMGANHQKEIAFLSSIAEPNHGLITNIGKAHLEGFGGLEGVFKGKTELYDFMGKQGGTLFVNSRNNRLEQKAKRRVGENVITFPSKGSFYELEMAEEQPHIKVKTKAGKSITTQLSGIYNFSNIAAALCIGRYFEVDENLALQAVAAYVPDQNRSEVLEHGSNTIYMDAYNANPTSMSMSLRSFAAKDGKKVAILGDMFELGDSAIEEHSAIGSLCEELHLQHVLFCGALMNHAYKAFPEGRYFNDKAKLANYLKSAKLSEHLILIKGSRGMALETILDHL